MPLTLDCKVCETSNTFGLLTSIFNFNTIEMLKLLDNQARYAARYQSKKIV